MCARSVSSRSGPSGPSPNSTSTAPSRGVGPRAARRRSGPWRGSSAPPSRTGSSHAGRRRRRRRLAGSGTPRAYPAGDVDAGEINDEAGQLVEGDRLVAPLDRAVRVDPDDARAAPARGSVSASAPPGSATWGNVAPVRPAGRAPVGLGVLVVHAEHGEVVAGLLVQPREDGISFSHGPHQLAQTADHGRARRSCARSTARPPPRQGRVSSGRPLAAPSPGCGQASTGARPSAPAARGCRRRPGSRAGAVGDGARRRTRQRSRASTRRRQRRRRRLTHAPRCAPAWRPSTGSVGPSPYAGHQRATGQAPQAGLRAWQTRRPCQIRWWLSIVQSAWGTARRRRARP